jgi:hypothetical protein
VGKAIFALAVALNICAVHAEDFFGPNGEILRPLTCTSDGSGAMSRRGRTSLKFLYKDTVRLLLGNGFEFSNVRYEIIDSYDFGSSIQFVAVPQESRIGASLITVSEDGRRLFYVNNDLDAGIARPYSCGETF